MGVIALREALLVLTAATPPGAPRPTDRMARPHHVQPSLAVAGPHFGAQHHPGESSAYHPVHDDRPLVIEPDQMRCPSPDDRADEAVIPIGHPGLGRNGTAHPS